MEEEVYKDLEDNKHIGHREKVIYKMWIDKAIQQGRTQQKIEDIEEFKKIIDEMLKKGLNGRRYNFMINGEELKSKLKDKGEKDE